MKKRRFTADNFTGCLVGGAIGDALGFIAEPLTMTEIFDRFGEEGIVDFSQKDGDVVVSDDTQMTLFTANALLYYTCGGKAEGMSEEDCLYAAYIDWLRSQDFSQKMNFPVKSVSWLLNVEELRCRRSPGDVTLSALNSGKIGTMKNRISEQSDCGAMVRSAPIGLFEEEPEHAMSLAAKAAAITHGNPMEFLSAAAYAYLLHQIVNTDLELIDILSGVAQSMKNEFSTYPEVVELLGLLEKAVRFSITALESDAEEMKRNSQEALQSETDPVILIPPVHKYGNLNMKEEAERIDALGVGWNAGDSLAVAVYCCLRFGDDFETAIRVAANHSGNSAAVAAMTGALIGAEIGNANMPTKYVMLLELYDVISEIANDLFDCCGNPESAIAEERNELYEKYVTHSYC